VSYSGTGWDGFFHLQEERSGLSQLLPTGYSTYHGCLESIFPCSERMVGKREVIRLLPLPVCPSSSRKGYTARSLRCEHSEGDSLSVHRQNYDGERRSDNVGF